MPVRMNQQIAEPWWQYLLSVLGLWALVMMLGCSASPESYDGPEFASVLKTIPPPKSHQNRIFFFDTQDARGLETNVSIDGEPVVLKYIPKGRFLFVDLDRGEYQVSLRSDSLLGHKHVLLQTQQNEAYYFLVFRGGLLLLDTDEGQSQIQGTRYIGNQFISPKFVPDYEGLRTQ